MMNDMQNGFGMGYGWAIIAAIILIVVVWFIVKSLKSKK